MRTGRPGAGSSLRTLPGIRPRQRRIVLLARFEQQLHAEADAEQRAVQAVERVAQPKRVDPPHGKAGRADAGQSTRSAAAISAGSAVSVTARAEPLEGDRDRADIAVAEIDDARRSQHALRARDASPIAFARDRLAQRPAERLEAGLGLVMVVLAGDADVDRRAQGCRRRSGRCGRSSRSDRRRYGWR